MSFTFPVDIGKGVAMRFVIAAVLILGVGLPAAEAAGDKGACKSRCDTNYQFCVNRATTKQARKSCKVDRKTCKATCK
jgi:hypothetical protein